MDLNDSTKQELFSPTQKFAQCSCYRHVRACITNHSSGLIIAKVLQNAKHFVKRVKKVVIYNVSIRYIVKEN